MTERRGLGTILCLVLAMAAVLSLLMVVDGSNAQGTQSHIGQTVELVRRDGAAAVDDYHTQSGHEHQAAPLQPVEQCPHCGFGRSRSELYLALGSFFG